MDSIGKYASGSDDDTKQGNSNAKDLISGHAFKTAALSAGHMHDLYPRAPEQIVAESQYIDPFTKEISRSIPYASLYQPAFGPVNPKASTAIEHSHVAGSYELNAISDGQFEAQRRSFHSHRHAVDPIAFVGGHEKSLQGKRLPEPDDAAEKKRKPFGSATDGTYVGPWAGYTNEKVGVPMGPSEEDLARQKELAGLHNPDSHPLCEPGYERTIFHGKSERDYLGRTYMHVPQDLGIVLKDDETPDCFVPKKVIHTWTGHTAGVSAIRFIPNSGHLLLSASLDHKVKLWDVYHQRACLRTFSGHGKAVRDICFTNNGAQFLSCGYDKYIKLWDTETGQVVGSYQANSTPYCIKFNPDADKQNIFLAGCADKKILQWDKRSGQIVQEYNEHLGAVNSITFIDENRRFVSTSDDKSLRVWDVDIPVTIKYIAEPSMHSMPCAALHPSGKFFATQSMDNRIHVFSATDRVKEHPRKSYAGHIVAGYACQISFSPDGKYLTSGDGEGKVWFWDWKTHRVVKSMRAHDKVTIDCQWHPRETSKVATASWDGTIKFWD